MATHTSTKQMMTHVRRAIRQAQLKEWEATAHLLNVAWTFAPTQHRKRCANLAEQYWRIAIKQHGPTNVILFLERTGRI